jgi:hypothetical protein
MAGRAPPAGVRRRGARRGDARTALRQVVRGGEHPTSLARFAVGVRYRASFADEGVAWSVGLPKGRFAAAAAVLTWDALQVSPSRSTTCPAWRSLPRTDCRQPRCVAPPRIPAGHRQVELRAVHASAKERYGPSCPCSPEGWTWPLPRRSARCHTQASTGCTPNGSQPGTWPRTSCPTATSVAARASPSEHRPTGFLLTPPRRSHGRPSHRRRSVPPRSRGSARPAR